MPPPSTAADDPMRALFDAESGPSPQSATLRESVRRRMFGAPAAPPAHPRAIGRYRIERVLGAGGMGVVYLAHDPKLGRPIALKLLHATERPQSRERRRIRLFREAQGLARLSHPNVVNVYDVDVHGDQLFLVMDYAPGETLQRWLEERPRGWQEVVAVMRQVGEGLVAAHAAGLVHRDLKPSNILVGADGRARIIDFGLVRFDEVSASMGPGATVEELGDPAASTSGGAGPELDAELTAPGALIGTLAYIAPEVFTGAPADARSDLYSFCVTLFEALHGVRPFRADGRDALILQIIEGRVQPAPAGRVPLWLHRLCLRGLATDPARRPPSLAALLAELDRPRRRPAAVWLAATAAALGLSVVGALGALTLASPEADRACLPARSVWGSAERAAVEAGLTASRLPYAARTWADVDAAFSAHAAALARSGARICGDDPASRARRGCLEDAAAAAAALVVELGRGEPALVEGALERVLTLPDPELCWEGDLPAPNPVVAVLGGALEARLAAAERLADDGRYSEALARVAEVQAVAEGADQVAALAAAWALRARIELHLDDPGAPTSLALAESLALRAPRRPGASTLALRVAALASRPGDDPEPWLHLVRAELRSRALTPAARADLHAALGDLATARGDLIAARAHRIAARDLRVRLLGDAHPQVAAAWHDLGAAHDRLGERAQARAAYERALGLRQRLLRPDHPAIAATLTNLAGLHAADGDPLAARVTYERALAHTRAAFGDHHPRVAVVLHDLGVLARQQGDLDGALAFHGDALAIRRAAYPPEHPLIAASLNALAVAHKRRGDLDLADREYREALAIRERVLGADHPDVASTSGSLASLLLERGERAEALALLDRADAIYRSAGPFSDVDRAWILRLRGGARLGGGDPGAAVLDLRQAVLLAEATVARDPAQRVELERARALLDAAEFAAARAP